MMFRSWNGLKKKIDLGFGRLHSSPNTSYSYFHHSTASEGERSLRLHRCSPSDISLFHQAMIRTEKARDLEEFVVEGEKKSLSECSSGCQSGWTLYLGYSQTSPNKDTSAQEDDLSMLSDASSGPPNIKQDDYFNACYCSTDGDDSATSLAANWAKRKRTEKEPNQKRNREQEHLLFLEDTASCSHLLCFPKNTSSVSSSKKLPAEDALELSGGFSANHFEGCRQDGENNQL